MWFLTYRRDFGYTVRDGTITSHLKQSIIFLINWKGIGIVFLLENLKVEQAGTLHCAFVGRYSLDEEQAAVARI